MDHKLISAKGGRMTKKKYSEVIMVNGKKVNKHYSEMGKRGGKAKLKMFGVDYFKNMAAKSVEARKKKIEDAKSLGQKIVETVTSI